jgi:hypothetical protein
MRGKKRKEQTMTILVTQAKEFRRHPRLLALPAAAGLAIALAACGSSGSPSAKPAGPAGR